MVANVTLSIENLYLETGSYKDALIEFADRFEIYDYEDILKVINPILIEKIKQEYIDLNYFPDKKKKPSVFDFMKN
jgi:hypothetical protein